MTQKVYLYVRKGSEEDIREALDDILSSGLIEKITDEAGSPLSLEVRTAGDAPETARQARSAARTPSARKIVLAKKTSVRSGIEQITAMTQTSLGEEETCLGQMVTLVDRGGGKAELTAQRLKALWDMNQPRVFMMELPGRAVIEGSACAWYPLDGMEQTSAT